MSSLYQIDRDIEDALSKILEGANPDTGEVDDSLVEELEALQFEKSVKLDNIGAYIKNLRAEADALKNEEESLKKRRKSKEREIDNLLKYVDSVLRGEKYETTRASFSYRKSDEVVVDDLDALVAYSRQIEETGCQGFVNMKVEYVPDKAMIKKTIKDGELIGLDVQIDGVHLNKKNELKVK